MKMRRNGSLTVFGVSCKLRPFFVSVKRVQSKLLISVIRRSARRATPARQDEDEPYDYWLNATPLKEATPIELDVATGVRSPWSSMAKTET